MDEKRTLEILRSIKTVEDFKEKKDLLMDSVEKLMNANLETLKKLQSSDLPKAELQLELFKFQKEWEAMGNEVEPEFNRLDTIPGIEEYGEAIQKEFFKRMEPIAMEGEKIRIILGGGDPSGIPGPSEMPPQPPSKQIERQKLDELETLYGIKSLEELENSKDSLFNILKNKLENDLSKLRSFKSNNTPKEEYMPEFQEIVKQMDIFGNEMECEFNRLKDLPDGTKHIEMFHEEIIGPLVPLLDEIDDLREKLG
jgi:hypothetical protein